MKRAAFTALFVVSSSLAFVQGVRERSLVIVFGPAAEEAGKLAAHSAARAALEWLKAPGAAAEILRAGASEGQQLSKFMQSKDAEQALVDAARTGREGGLLAFLNTLDRASYSLARKPPGRRLLVAILETPSPSTAESMRGGSAEASNRLAQTVEFCKSKAVSVVVVSLSPPVAKDLNPDLESLATATGGALVRDLSALDASIGALVPEEKAEVKPAQPAAPATPSVHASLVRIYPLRKSTLSYLGPMNGLFTVESPFSALEFQTDEKSGNYVARARVTEIIYNSADKAVWHQKKEIVVKGPSRKLEARRAGVLYYMREVKLPAGQYKLEATVEDLISGRSGSVTAPLRASDSLPGLAVSDAMLVKTLDESIDKFEADQVLAFEGRALVPLLDPVFRKDRPVDLEFYFIIYPDIQAAKPDIALEIVSNGQTVARSHIAFKDELRNAAAEGGTMDAKGEQKHEFPFLAALLGNTFSAGAYEARLTIHQGAKNVTRVVPFRVLDQR